MTFYRFLKSQAIFVVALSATSAALATATPYFGSNPLANGTVTGSPVTAHTAFIGALQSAQIESFSSFAVGDVASSLSILGGGASLSIDPGLGNGAIQNKIRPNGAAFPGRFDTTNNTGVLADTGSWFQSNRSFTINFSNGLKNAFGLYITDMGDFLSEITIDFLNGTTVVNHQVIVGGGNGSLNGALVFVGYSNDVAGFNKVAFNISQRNASDPTDPSTFDIIGFDDLTVGQLKPGSVPEPTSLALVGLALCAAGWARKGKQAA